MSERLHPDWPETAAEGAYWEMPDPVGDLVAALNVAQGERRLSLADLATVEAYYIRSDDGEWAPGRTVATELTMNLLGTLTTGEWFGLEAWNDYTGWGCGEGSDLYVGPTRDDVIRNGLTNDARSTLGLTLAQDPTP